MGEVRDKIVISGKKKSKEEEALFDTGADIGRVTKELVDELDLSIVEPEWTFTLADGQKMKAPIAEAVIKVKGCEMPILFAVMEKGEPKITIGLWTMQSMGIKLDPEKETYTVRCTLPKL